MIFRSQGHPQKLLGCFFHRPFGLLVTKLEAPETLKLPADNLSLMIIISFPRWKQWVLFPLGCHKKNKVLAKYYAILFIAL
jgi:hypothetical protein